MNTEPSILLLLFIGSVSGIASGLFGIGGGVLIVPGLVYLAGFPLDRATGTSLAVMLPPVGLAAMMEYHRHGNVDLWAALLIAAAFLGGGWLGAVFGNAFRGPYLRLAFGLLIAGLGIALVQGALRRLGWV